MKEEKYSIIRGDRSGVFFGIVEERKGREAKIAKARQIWYWEGARTILQIAKDGINGQSKVTVEAESVVLTDAIEIVPCSDEATEAIKGLPQWKI